jgi:hypothetical protein
MLTMLKKEAVFWLAIAWLFAVQAFLVAQCIGGCRQAQYAQNGQDCWLTTDMTCTNCGYCKTVGGDNTTSCQWTDQMTNLNVCNLPDCVLACTGIPNTVLQEVAPCKGVGNQTALPLWVCDVTQSGA